jgi:stress response protein YsnF
VRFEGDTTIVPIVKEVVVVEKALMLVEEVHIRKRSIAEPTQIPVSLRAECAAVDREPAPAPAEAKE